MQSNIKHDVIDSYKELIKNCRINIDNGVDVETNRLMILEYNKILNEVEQKPQAHYDELIKQIADIYRYSLFIHVALSRILPPIKTMRVCGKV